MRVLGKASARVLIQLGMVEVAATILICYTVAVMEGHVKPLLPTISACGEQPPEEFLFRYGFVVFAIFLVVEAVVLYGAGLFSELCMVLGIAAGLCLGVVGVVSAREVSSVHTACAVISILSEDIMMILVTYQALGRVSHFSITAKALCATVGCLATVGRLTLPGSPLPAALHGLHLHSSIALALLEWTNVLAIILFHWTYALDLTSLYLAEVNEEEVKERKEIRVTLKQLKIAIFVTVS